VNIDGLSDLWLTYQSAVGFVGINALLALSVYATLSCGQLSLANAGFMAIGSYTATLLTLHTALPFVAVLVLGAVATALVALPLGLPILRLRGVFLAIATIGWAEVVRLILINCDAVNGALGIDAIPQRSSVALIYITLVIVIFGWWRLAGSRAGYAIEAVRQDEAAASTMGINTTAYKLAMFVVAAGLAGLAGGLEAHWSFTISPSGDSVGRVIDMLAFAVVGGSTSFVGPLVGAAFLTLLPEGLREVSRVLGLPAGALRLFVFGVILLAVIVFLPNGIVSLPAAIRQRRRLRKASSCS
jgi:branched-chain amino acid transport system permease protein